MNIDEIQQAIAKLSPDELTQLREWLKEHEGKVKAGASDGSNASIEVTLKRLRGSLKGKGLLKALMEEKYREIDREK
ncbi:MAG: hypothetical protein HKUEN02_05270 [Anaerolineaceae bacterium]|nr:MAG: hypothetical protein HKUEN02_05270 [Anaerolineaceae bacterium]